MSFKFNKNKAEDFGLEDYDHINSIFKDSKDQTLWLQQSLYDFGWGNEYGFVRLPVLGFDDLWFLLMNSQIQENRYGAAYLLEEKHSIKLLNSLLEIFKDSTHTITDPMKEAFKILRLENARIRGDILGKSLSEIDQEFDKWKHIRDCVKSLDDH